MGLSNISLVSSPWAPLSSFCPPLPLPLLLMEVGVRSGIGTEDTHFLPYLAYLRCHRRRAFWTLVRHINLFVTAKDTGTIRPDHDSSSYSSTRPAPWDRLSGQVCSPPSSAPSAPGPLSQRTWASAAVQPLRACNPVLGEECCDSRALGRCLNLGVYASARAQTHTLYTTLSKQRPTSNREDTGIGRADACSKGNHRLSGFHTINLLSSCSMWNWNHRTRRMGI